MLAGLLQRKELKIYYVVFFTLTDPNTELNQFLAANHVGCQNININPDMNHCKNVQNYNLLIL